MNVDKVGQKNRNGNITAVLFWVFCTSEISYLIYCPQNLSIFLKYKQYKNLPLKYAPI